MPDQDELEAIYASPEWAKLKRENGWGRVCDFPKSVTMDKFIFKHRVSGEVWDASRLAAKSHWWEPYIRWSDVFPLLKLARDDYLEQHSDGETDCVTPYDHFFYGSD